MDQTQQDEVRQTPLVRAHREASARLVPFAGYLMPLQYTGIVDEHQTVRTALGLFDVSHMGEVSFRGTGAIATVERLVTNAVAPLRDGTAVYTPICYPDGGIVDDCIVYRHNAEHLMIVVNASNVTKDFDWFVANNGNDCTIENESDRFALLALQGPHAVETLQGLATSPISELPSFAFAATTVAGVSCTTARTGYTGEDGFEIFCSAEQAPQLWGALLEAGAPRGIKPCGLGARDTLRLEARLLLYGQDIDENTSPLEAGLGWTVKLRSKSFIGKQALVEQKRQGLSRKLSGLVMRSRGIARHGYAVHEPNTTGDLGPAIGTVTSGTHSPTLKQAIALAYVPTPHAQPGRQLVVDARGKPVTAEVVQGPFYQRGSH